MQLALQDAQHTADTALSVDLVVAHAPGTSQGDSAEVAAARSVWGNQPPQLYSSKWLTGHTLGASGALSSVLAVGVLQKGGVLSTPYSPPLHTPVRGSTPAQVVMVNGVGFGGVAASVVFRSLST
jgi:3-oxoacyl-(acyl-carrier-protein) synthase